ncbi:MAG: hypothetical protein SPI30_03530 [Prevotella sp.]|nr:hypothetical protein [Prevotella sp.]
MSHNSLELIPSIGSICTSGWYCGYQCLVRAVPTVGTVKNLAVLFFLNTS